ncbi:excisionase [Glaciimonas sp. PCH181]|nr:excisionase [Glaciimonas sp. PCH181]
MTWVKLTKYVDITGDTADAVRSRRKMGKWLDGTQCKIVDGFLWVNLAEAEKWVEQWGTKQALAA